MRENLLLHQVKELIGLSLIGLREGLRRLCPILEFNKHELVVASEHRARLIPVIVRVQLLILQVLYQIVHENGCLGHDACGGLSRWEVGGIPQREDILVLVVLQGRLIHVNEAAIRCGYRLQEVWCVLGRNHM